MTATCIRTSVLFLALISQFAYSQYEPSPAMEQGPNPFRETAPYPSQKVFDVRPLLGRLMRAGAMLEVVLTSNCHDVSRNRSCGGGEQSLLVQGGGSLIVPVPAETQWHSGRRLPSPSMTQKRSSQDFSAKLMFYSVKANQRSLIGQIEVRPGDWDQFLLLPEVISVEVFGGFDLVGVYDESSLGRYLRNSAPRGGAVEVKVYRVEGEDRIQIGEGQKVKVSELFARALDKSQADAPITISPTSLISLDANPGALYEVEMLVQIELAPILTIKRGVDLKGSLKMSLREWSGGSSFKIPLKEVQARY